MNLEDLASLSQVTDEEFKACIEEIQREPTLSDQQKQFIIQSLVSTPKQLQILKQLKLID